MNQKYNNTEKLVMINRYTNGESVASIVSDTGIPRSTLYAWIKQYHETQANGKSELTLKNFRLLEPG